MKQKFLYGLLAFLLVGSLFAVSFKGSDKVAESSAVAESVESAEAAEFTTASCGCSGSNWNGIYDTITTTEIDTLLIPITFASSYSASIHATVSTVSGTRAAKVYYEEANALSGATGWVTLDSMTIGVAPNNEYLIKRDFVYGRKARLRVKGTTGTFWYRINGYFKYK